MNSWSWMTFIEDGFRQAGHDVDAGTGPVAEPVGCHEGKLGLRGVDDDEVCASVDGFLDLDSGDGVVPGEVAAVDQDAPGIPEFAEAVGHGPDTQSLTKCGDGVGAAGGVGVVDVVGAHHRPGELLQQVVLFVGGPGGGDCAEGRALALGESGGDEVKGLVPGGFDQVAVLPDVGRGNTVVAVDVLVAELAPGTRVALVNGAAEVGDGADDPVLS